MSRRFGFFTLCLCLFVGFTAYAQSLLTIQNIRFGEHPDKNRLVVELNRISDFRTFILESPDRLVIDLPSFSWVPENIQNTKSSFIKGVRHGTLQPGISRIVMDLDRKTEIYNAYVLRADQGRPNRLVIDYGLRRSAQGIAKRYGTLSFAENPVKPIVSDLQKTAQTPAIKPKSKKKKQTIIIDPGHGGVDPGAVGKGKIYEKHITLSIAKNLRNTLEDTGRYKVIMTRRDDRFIKLYDRVGFARKNEGNLFISIHADSIGRSNVSGVSLYTLSDKASDAQTAKLAARENRADLLGGVDLDVEDQEVADILLDLVRRDTMNQSKFFANTLVGSFGDRGIKLLERPHRYAGFAVLKAPDIPSVLIETGFVSNSKEARMLMKKSHQQKIAKAIARGVDTYFEKLTQNAL